jgi:starch synthase
LTEQLDVPLIGIVSRLSDQKGFDLLARVLDDIMTVLDVQFVLLGTGDQHYHNMFTEFARQFRRRAAIFLTFNSSLAQRIYAGCDLFLMPSRFEPCGMGQMIALRYGTIPVVRLTGGLEDTVHNFDPLTGEGNGFAFQRYHHMDLFATIVRAIENYRHRDIWRALQQRGMAEDHSWAATAGRYIDLYTKAVYFAHQPTGETAPIHKRGAGSATSSLV